MSRARHAWLLRGCGLLALLALVVWGSAIAWHTHQLYDQARALGGQALSLSPAAQEDGQTLGAPELRQLRAQIEGIERETLALRAMTSWLTGPLAQQKAWPALANVAGLAHEGLAAVEHLTGTAWWVLLELQSDQETAGTFNRAPGMPVLMRANPAARALGAVHRSRAKLSAASTSLHRMMALAQGLSWARPWEPSMRQLALAVDGAMALAAIVAQQPDARFLLILQNPDELRASGGFISAAVVVALQEMRIDELRYLNSYDVESYWQAHPPAPGPLQEHMGASILLFRDANWAADFRESAEVLAALYEMDMGERIDAVVACNATFLELLLDALGPVPVPDYEVTLTAENVVETAVAFWERPLGATAIDQRDQAFVDWLTHRKDFGRAALAALVPRLERLSGHSLGRLLQSFVRAIEEQHLLAWVPNNTLAQRDLDRLGLSGRVRVTGDANLMVVDSNVGWNKVDRHIERAVDYVLTQREGGWQAEVTLTYVNHASAVLSQCEHRAQYEDSYEAMTQQCYWNYVRVLVPAQSILERTLGLTGAVDQGSESGQRLYGFLLVVPPGEQRTVGLSYLIPQPAETQRLALTLQAQPGVQRALRVWVRPSGRARAHRLPPDWRWQGDHFYWSETTPKDHDAVLYWQSRP